MLPLIRQAELMHLPEALPVLVQLPFPLHG